MNRFSGKTIYITGGSSGIGLATAAELVVRGARILLLARDESKLKRAVDSLPAGAGTGSVQHEGVVEYRCLDVADRRQCEQVLTDAVREFGKPDILINCHGFCIPGCFEDLTNSMLEQQWNVNLVGVWNTVQILLPSIKERRGTIANVSSLGGVLGTLGYSAYNATKFGVIGLSEALRNELCESGVRVQVLCPPDTDTPGFERENLTKPEVLKIISKTVPLLRPEQVARTFVRKLNTGRFIITAGFMSRLTRFVKRIAPRIAFAILDSEVRKANREISRLAPGKE